MTRTNPPSDGETKGSPAEEPRARQDLQEPGLPWFSWFRFSWATSPPTPAAIRNPIATPATDRRMYEPIPAALQGIKLLGAKEIRNEDYRIALVTRFLAKIQAEEALVRSHQSEAIAALLGALTLWGRKLRDRIAALPSNSTPPRRDGDPQPAREPTDFEGGPHWLGEQPRELEEAYAATLEEIGKYGAEQAARLRAQPAAKSTEDFWGPWLPPAEGGTPVRHGWLVRVLWQDVVRPRLERATRKPPALARLVHTPVAALLSGAPRRQLGGQTVLDLGLPQPCIIRAEVAAIPHAARGLDLFRSIHAHKVLLHLAFAAHEKALAGELDPRVLTYEGGFAALAEASGIEGRHGAVKARELLEAFSALDLSLPGGDHARGLLSFIYGEARRNRKAYLKIVAGLPLLPDYVHELRRVAGNTSIAARREQDLIPLLPVPPTIGRANDAGPQATLQLRVVAHLRDHASDLAEGRGAPLPADTWTQLAAESHVPRSLAPKLLPHWLEDHQDGPAVLKRVDRDRYTLSDAHAAARAFLEDGGRRSLDSSEAGRRSTTKRATAQRRGGQS